jgi:hypothetical protein
MILAIHLSPAKRDLRSLGGYIYQTSLIFFSLFARGESKRYGDKSGKRLCHGQCPSEPSRFKKEESLLCMTYKRSQTYKERIAY